MPGPRGGGVEARASDGATQPEVAAVLGFSASWRYSSRLTGSAGLASNGRKKRATCPPRHWVRSAGAVGDSKETKHYYQFLDPQSYS